jgi:hypothetical protein
MAGIEQPFPERCVWVTFRDQSQASILRSGNQIDPVEKTASP